MTSEEVCAQIKGLLAVTDCDDMAEVGVLLTQLRDKTAVSAAVASHYQAQLPEIKAMIDVVDIRRLQRIINDYLPFLQATGNGLMASNCRKRIEREMAYYLDDLRVEIDRLNVTRVDTAHFDALALCCTQLQRIKPLRQFSPVLTKSFASSLVAIEKHVFTYLDLIKLDDALLKNPQGLGHYYAHCQQGAAVILPEVAGLFAKQLAELRKAARQVFAALKQRIDGALAVPVVHQISVLHDDLTVFIELVGQPVLMQFLFVSDASLLVSIRQRLLQWSVQWRREFFEQLVCEQWRGCYDQLGVLQKSLVLDTHCSSGTAFLDLWRDCYTAYHDKLAQQASVFEQLLDRHRYYRARVLFLSLSDNSACHLCAKLKAESHQLVAHHLGELSQQIVERLPLMALGTPEMAVCLTQLKCIRELSAQYEIPTAQIVDKLQLSAELFLRQVNLQLSQCQDLTSLGSYLRNYPVLSDLFDYFNLPDSQMSALFCRLETHLARLMLCRQLCLSMCQREQALHLTTLVLSGLDLECLDIHHTQHQLEKLSLHSCPRLTTIDWRLPALTSVEFANCPKLTAVKFYANALRHFTYRGECQRPINLLYLTKTPWRLQACQLGELAVVDKFLPVFAASIGSPTVQAKLLAYFKALDGLSTCTATRYINLLERLPHQLLSSPKGLGELTQWLKASQSHTVAVPDMALGVSDDECSAHSGDCCIA